MPTIRKGVSFGLALCLTISFMTSSTLVSYAQNAVDKPKEVRTEILLDRVSCSWDGEALDAYLITQPAITMLKISVPPKTRLGSHYHSVINVGYMLEGELTVVAENGKTTTIKTGEPVVEMLGTVHYGENRGDSTAVILVFYAGDATTPITTPITTAAD